MSAAENPRGHVWRERERVTRALSVLEWQIKVATERPSNYDGRVIVNATDLRTLIAEVRRNTGWAEVAP